MDTSTRKSKNELKRWQEELFSQLFGSSSRRRKEAVIDTGITVTDKSRGDIFNIVNISPVENKRILKPNGLKK